MGFLGAAAGFCFSGVVLIVGTAVSTVIGGPAAGVAYATYAGPTLLATGTVGGAAATGPL